LKTNRPLLHSQNISKEEHDARYFCKLDTLCKGSKDLPIVTIRVKKAEKTLQDVSNSSAAGDGVV